MGIGSSGQGEGLALGARIGTLNLKKEKNMWELANLVRELAEVLFQVFPF